MTGLPAGEAAAAGGSMATTGPAETTEALTDRVRVASTGAPETLALGERLGRVARAGGVIDERQEDGLTVVEWPDRMGPVLPRARLDVHIEGTGDEPRDITIVARAERYRPYLDAAP